MDSDHEANAPVEIVHAKDDQVIPRVRTLTRRIRPL